jgi:hypothetical protein
LKFDEQICQIGTRELSPSGVASEKEPGQKRSTRPTLATPKATREVSRIGISNGLVLMAGRDSQREHRG